MKKTLLTLSAISLLSICLVACGWQPSVTPAPITPPWNGMNLPVKENAVVWGSTEKQFKAVHKDDKKTVMKNYTDALKAQGWTLSKFDTDGSGAFEAEMEKGAEKIGVRVYDFDNTGVIIEKK